LVVPSETEQSITAWEANNLVSTEEMGLAGFPYTYTSTVSSALFPTPTMQFDY